LLASVNQLTAATDLSSRPREQQRQGPELSPAVDVRVWFFGLISIMTGEREVNLELPSGSTARDVLAALGRRYGETFSGNLMRTKDAKASCCRISVDGRLVRDVDAPLTSGRSASVEIILLAAPEGG
jgi:hypothetical protein